MTVMSRLISQPNTYYNNYRDADFQLSPQNCTFSELFLVNLSHADVTDAIP